MTQHKYSAKAPASASRRSERLKDEVYRQMYRLEAGRPGAELCLAITLLHAWMASGSEADIPQNREWLLKICSICLPMIEATEQVSEAEPQCAQ